MAEPVTSSITLPPPPTPPSWWKTYQYSGAYDPNAELAMTVNTLIPYMSPIDKRYWTGWLYQQDPAKFSYYNPAGINDYGVEGGEAARGSWVDAGRATNAWNALQATLLGTTTPKPVGDMGAAVPWMQRVMETAKKYAPGGGESTGWDRRTRAQERAMQSDLASLWSEASASTDLQPYLELAKRFVAPSYQTAPISTPTPMGICEAAYPTGTYTSRMNYVTNPRFL